MKNKMLVLEVGRANLVLTKAQIRIWAKNNGFTLHWKTEGTVFEGYVGWASRPRKKDKHDKYIYEYVIREESMS